MGILDSLFGRKDDAQQQTIQQPYDARQNRPYNDAPRAARPSNADEQALARYRYMLQTAPPEEIEQAHQEAFARLTPEQRQMVLQQMTQIVPPGEAAHLSDNPRDLARAATRAEMRQPGAMNRMFGGANHMGAQPNQQSPNQQFPNQQGQMGGGMMGGMGGGMMGGMGGMLAGGLLTSIAGGFIGSSIANQFFGHGANEQGFQSSPEAQAVDGGVSDYNGGDFQETGLDSSADPYGDPEAGMQDTGFDSSGDPYGDPGSRYRKRRGRLRGRRVRWRRFRRRRFLGIAPKNAPMRKRRGVFYGAFQSL